MAKVPVVAEQSVDPRPESIPFDSGSGVSVEAFGAGAARSQAAAGKGLIELGGQIGSFGDQLAAADLRLARRRDSNDRARLNSDATAKLEALFSAEQDTGSNFATEDSINAYNQGILKILGDAAKSTQGHGTESLQIFVGELEKLGKTYQDKGVNAGVASLEVEEQRLLKDKEVELTRGAFTSPELGDVLRQDADKHVANSASTDTPEQTEEKRRELYEAIASGAFDKHMTLGGAVEYNKARKILNDRRTDFSTEKMQQNQNRLLKAEIEFFKQTGDKLTIIPPGGKAVDGTGKTIATNPKADKEEKNTVLKPGDKAFDDKGKLIAENPAIPDEPKALFGEGATGRAHALLVTPDGIGMTPIARFASKTSPTLDAEDQMILAAIALTVETNKATGTRSAMNPVYSQALEARGFSAEMFGDPSFPLQSPPSVDLSDQVKPTPEAAPEPLGEAAAPDTPTTPFSAPGGAPEPTEDGEAPILSPDITNLMGDRTIAELVMEEAFTGIEGAAKSFFGKTPLVGSGAGFVDTVRSAIPLATERLITALQQNPKFAVTERKQLEEKINLDPAIWDNPQAMLGNVVGVSLFLGSVENELKAALKKPAHSAARVQDRRTLRLVEDFRDRLSPPIIASTDDKEIQNQLTTFMKENPPGSPVIALDKSGSWNLFKVPGEVPK